VGHPPEEPVLEGPQESPPGQRPEAPGQQVAHDDADPDDGQHPGDARGAAVLAVAYARADPHLTGEKSYYDAASHGRCRCPRRIMPDRCKICNDAANQYRCICPRRSRAVTRTWRSGLAIQPCRDSSSLAPKTPCMMIWETMTVRAPPSDCKASTGTQRLTTSTATKQSAQPRPHHKRVLAAGKADSCRQHVQEVERRRRRLKKRAQRRCAALHGDPRPPLGCNMLCAM